jgi:ribosomal protein S18 acetylase RimI-like enzyme
VKDPRIVVAPHRHRPIEAAAVKALFDGEGWWPERRVHDIADLLDRGPAVGAWNGARVVGFARAVTDGLFRAYIEDLTVAVDERGQGVGEALVEALHHELAAVDVISAFFEPSLTDLYARLGYRSTHQVVAHRRQGTGR